MKLAAIYNVWEGCELLSGSINCIKKHVDLIIIVYQSVSNFGEHYDPTNEIFAAIKGIKNVPLYFYVPDLNMPGAHNEKAKRNIGLDIARENNCTHFLHLDCDEFYEDFGAAKKEFIESKAEGSVCRLYTYFKRPTWRLDPIESYFVPFIHELTPQTVSGVREYPYYCDPTRRINTQNVVLNSHFMHHFSYVRKDIDRKCRNSSAGNLLNNKTLMNDYHSEALETSPNGFYLQNFDRKIIVVDDLFGIDLVTP